MSRLNNVKVFVLANPNIKGDVEIRFEEPSSDYEYMYPFEHFDWDSPEHQEIGLIKVNWKECILNEIG